MIPPRLCRRQYQSTHDTSYFALSTRINMITRRCRLVTRLRFASIPARTPSLLSHETLDACVILRASHSVPERKAHDNSPAKLDSLPDFIDNSPASWTCYQNKYGSSKSRPLSIAGFRLLRTHVVLVYASAVRGIIRHYKSPFFIFIFIS